MRPHSDRSEPATTTRCESPPVDADEGPLSPVVAPMAQSFVQLGQLAGEGDDDATPFERHRGRSDPGPRHPIGPRAEHSPQAARVPSDRHGADHREGQGSGLVGRRHVRDRGSGRDRRRMLVADPAGRIGGERGIGNRFSTGLARVVGAVAQPVQRPVDVVQHPGRLRQVGFVALLHRGRVPRVPRRPYP